MTPPHALVVMPAHDEEALAGAALQAIVAALDLARASGVIASADVVVSAHRCTDATARVAASALAALTTGRWLVHVDESSTTVGAVRARAVRTALTRLAPSPSHTWLLSTDADSVVPHDWVASLLGPAARNEALAVAGMVELVDWTATAATRREYAAIIAGGILDGDRHTHLYAANLAVRLDAYLAVGGFASVEHGEEVHLVADLRAAGLPVTSTRHSPVLTSGRMPGRATAGLGALLESISHAAPAGVA